MLLLLIEKSKVERYGPIRRPIVYPVAHALGIRLRMSEKIDPWRQQGKSTKQSTTHDLDVLCQITREGLSLGRKGHSHDVLPPAPRNRHP